MYTKTKTLLKLDNIGLSFGTKKVLRDINLEIKDIVREGAITGQIITLLGRSGIGKSQLMSIIAGLKPPTSGRVLVGEKQLEVTPGMVGMVMQNYPLLNHRTVIANLEIVSRDKQKIGYYLSEFGMTEHKNKYPVQLSGGQRQRIAVIQQLLCSEHFILLDEPLSGADIVTVDKLCSMVSKIAEMDEDNTVIISTHILEPALAISDEVVIIGNEKDEQGNTIEGATIICTEDLAAQGLAWRHDIYTDPAFVALCNKIRGVFKMI